MNSPIYSLLDTTLLSSSPRNVRGTYTNPSASAPLTLQYQRIKARALELQRDKEAALKLELAHKADQAKAAAKEEAEVCSQLFVCQPGNC